MKDYVLLYDILVNIDFLLKCDWFLFIVFFYIRLSVIFILLYCVFFVRLFWFVRFLFFGFWKVRVGVIIFFGFG